MAESQEKKSRCPGWMAALDYGGQAGD